MPTTSVVGKKELSEYLQSRVAFMWHSFLEPHSVKDADVYFFRAVFQNWPDSYCVRILQNLVPVLKKGARVGIHDPMTPEKGLLGPWQERQKSSMNSRMFVLFKCHHRYTEHWHAIFTKADPRFRIVGLTPSDIAARAMLNIEVVWGGWWVAGLPRRLNIDGS